MSFAKVLLVDDEVGFLNIMQKRLTGRDLEVLTAESGDDCLGVISKNKDVDVVILDVKMPGMDGIEVLKALRRDHPLVEVIMLTGHATVETAIMGMKNGAFDYLMKPCDIDNLLNLVKSAKKKKADHEEKILQAQMKEITGRMI
ncbi:MAG: response regulator [Desulfovibrionaceae bacterium]|nr:response regulator [Desulfovibrionaceae bacterium]